MFLGKDCRYNWGSLKDDCYECLEFATDIEKTSDGNHLKKCGFECQIEGCKDCPTPDTCLTCNDEYKGRVLTDQSGRIIKCGFDCQIEGCDDCSQPDTCSKFSEIYKDRALKDKEGNIALSRIFR